VKASDRIGRLFRGLRPYRARLARRVMAPMAVIGVAAVGGFLAHQSAPETAVPTFAVAPIARDAQDPSLTDAAYDNDVTIRRGDTLISALLRAGVDHLEANAVVAALKPYFNPRKLQAGQTISLHFERSQEDAATLAGLTFDQDIDRTIAAERSADGWSAEVKEVPLVRVTMRTAGEITDSLYLSAARENVPAPVVADLIRIFSYDVDFQREVQKGDKFEIYFERFASPEGRRTKEGDILYAQLTLSGKPITLYRHALADGEVDYFHENGKSAKKTLLRTPVDGARLSSGYGYRRHPILGYNKLHKGLDFAASSGTPIMAAGDGVVERASVYGGYGKYVRIRHNGTYSTAYAHLSAYGKGVRSGSRVKQGQVIGYVGSTGRSTGPHLHYEVMANGHQVNPRHLKLPTGRELTGTQLAAFNAYREALNMEIAAIPLPYEVAALMGKK